MLKDQYIRKNLTFQMDICLKLLFLTSISLASEDEDFCDVNKYKCEESVERTFIAVKPDAVQRGLVGEILSRFERKGFKLVAMKLVSPTTDLLETHYEEHRGKSFFEPLIKYMSSGPVVATVWEGKGVIVGGRSLLGATNPLKAAPGTIRGNIISF